MTTANLSLPTEQTAHARGSSFNALAAVLDGLGMSLDKGGAGVGWVRFAAQPNADDLLTINGRIYCFSPSGTPPAHDVAVTIGGTVTLTISALLAAINADLDTRVHAAKGAGAVVCMLQSTDTGTTSNFAIVESTSSARMVVSAALAVGGKARKAVAKLRFGQYVVTAADVTALAVPAELPIATFPTTDTPQIVMVGALTGAGVVVPLDATVTLVWRQFNLGFWTLCVQDATAATFTAADVISVIVAG